MLNGCGGESAMEVDSAPMLSTSQHTADLHTHHEEDSRQPQAMDFDLNQDHIRKVLAFGKDLQQLYSTLGGDSDGKMKVLLQVLIQVLVNVRPLVTSVFILVSVGLLWSAGIHRPLLQSCQLPPGPSAERACVCSSEFSHIG